MFQPRKLISPPRSFACISLSMRALRRARYAARALLYSTSTGSPSVPTADSTSSPSFATSFLGSSMRSSGVSRSSPTGTPSSPSRPRRSRSFSRLRPAAEEDVEMQQNPEVNDENGEPEESLLQQEESGAAMEDGAQEEERLLQHDEASELL